MSHRTDLNRLAGLALALGVLTYLVTITLYVTAYGLPSATGEGDAVTLGDRIRHYTDNRSLVEGIWQTEIFATLFLAFGGFGLAGRQIAGPRQGVATAGWLLVGIGATIMLVMFPFMLGGYGPASEAAPEYPALFSVLQNSMIRLFHFSNFVVFLGLGLAFLGELHAAGVLRRWLVVAGAVLCLYSGAAFLGLFFGFGSLALAGPPSLLAYLLTALLGVQIARYR